MSDARIILEPVGRNTAPAVAVAALSSVAQGEDPVLLLMPADHLIRDVTEFQSAVAKGLGVAKQGKLVTFGIVPQLAHTGFGYIKQGNQLEGLEGYIVQRFIEKPDIETAQTYLNSGNYLWNSGMFLFRASVFLDELKRLAPEVYACASAALEYAENDLDYLRLDPTKFEQSPDVSIDYAVMEHTDKAVVVPLDAGWSDVGSWQALWEVGEQDDNGNVTSGDVLLEDTHGCLVHAHERLVTAVGVRDKIIVETADAILVADKSESEKVKEIVKRLKDEGRTEGELHRRVYRPWGAYDLIPLIPLIPLIASRLNTSPLIQVLLFPCRCITIARSTG